MKRPWPGGPGRDQIRDEGSHRVPWKKKEKKKRQRVDRRAEKESFCCGRFLRIGLRIGGGETVKTEKT